MELAELRQSARERRKKAEGSGYIVIRAGDPLKLPLGQCVKLRVSSEDTLKGETPFLVCFVLAMDTDAVSYVVFVIR